MKNKKFIGLIVVGIIFSILFSSQISNVKNGVAFDETQNTYNEQNSFKSNILPKSSKGENFDNIEAIFDSKLNDFDFYGYFPQIYKSSLQATYYGLYILDVLGKLSMLNKTEVTNYIISKYNQESRLFYDEYAYRYLDADFSLVYYPLTTLLEVNCYAVLSLNILGKLDLINHQEMINFIWSCFNPEGNYNGFIGQPYSQDLEYRFRISTMDNTYFAIQTLDLLLTNWDGYTTEKSRIIQYINSLQSIDVNSWNYGGFFNDNNDSFDSINPIAEPSLLSSYYCINSLELFGMEESISISNFHQFLSEMYNSEKNYFRVTLESYDNSNLFASAIGLELSDVTGFSQVDRASIIDFILNNRNSLNIWNVSTTLPYHELIDTLQIIRSLKNSNVISQLNEEEREEIAQAIFLFKQSDGFSLLSNDYVSLELIHTIVSSFEMHDRINDLNILGLYENIESCFTHYNDPVPHDNFVGSKNMDTQISTRFRSNPIEYYCSVKHNHIDYSRMLLSHKNTYMALDTLAKLYKLDDFSTLNDLNSLISSIIDSQFLIQGYEAHGAFLPTLFCTMGSIDFQVKKIYLEYSYYAVKTLELLADFLDLGEINVLPFNKTAIYNYVKRNVYETVTVLYFNPKYTSNIETILESTFYMINILKILGLYDLNNQKIKNFLLQNINYNNLKNIYYQYKISEILNLNIEFDCAQTIALCEKLYSKKLNEYYLDTKFDEVCQASFLWVVDIAKNDYLRIDCDYYENIMLGGVNSLTVSFRNLVIDDFSDEISVVFESLQFGIINLEKQIDTTYHIDFKVPESSTYYPKVDGLVAIYRNFEQLGQVPVTFSTFYLLHDSGLSVIDKRQGSIFEMNISYEFSSGQNPALDSTIIAKIHKNMLVTESTELYREDYPELSKFTMYYENQENINYFIQFVLFDAFHTDGKLLYEYEASSSNEDSRNPISPLKSIIWSFVFFVIFMVICGLSLYASLKVVKWIFRRKRRRKKENTPLKLELNIKNGKKMTDIIDEVLQNDDL